ncbi:MAG: hypothetical protein QM765_37950 [Myxococcales bacterium]
MLRLRLAFVDAHLEKHDKDATEKDFELIAQELEKRGDNDLRRFAADRLCALSAQMFASERALAGNTLLRAAGRLTPTPIFEAFLPARVDVLVDDLPEASQKLLEKMVEEAPKPGLTWTNPWFLLFAGLAALGIYALVLSAASDPDPWGTGEVMGIALLAVPAGLLLATGIRGLRSRRTRSWLKPYSLIHPLYLLQTHGEKVSAWPLIRLQSATVTDQHNNGVYSGTEVFFDFGGTPCRITISGPEPAREFAQSVLDGRGRALTLLARGLLGAEPAADLIPHALLSADRKPTARERAWAWSRRKAWGAGLAFAALLCAISPPIAARVADSSAGQKALESGSVRRLREYLGSRPNGPSAPAITAALDRAYAERLQRAESRAGTPLPKVQKLLASLRVDPRLELPGRGREPLGGGGRPGVLADRQDPEGPQAAHQVRRRSAPNGPAAGGGPRGLRRGQGRRGEAPGALRHRPHRGLARGSGPAQEPRVRRPLQRRPLAGRRDPRLGPDRRAPRRRLHDDPADAARRSGGAPARDGPRGARRLCRRALRRARPGGRRPASARLGAGQGSAHPRVSLPRCAMKPALWKVLVPGGLVVVLLLVGGVWWERSHATVHVLDGLSRPVSVAFGDLPPLTVNAHGRNSLDVPTGPVKVVVRLDDRVLSTEEIIIPKGVDFVGYNVLGAAPLFKLRAHYSANPDRNAKPDIEMLAGRTFVALDGVDAVFTDLPEKISTKDKYGEVIRIQVDSVENSGWEMSGAMLLSMNKFADAAKAFRQIVRVEEEAIDLTLVSIERAEGRPAALAFAKELVREKPDSYEAHRALQWLMRQVEGMDAARAFYRARLAERPDSAFDQLLFARVDENTAAEATLRKLLSAAPNDERVLRYLAVTVARAERWPEAAALLDRAPRNDDASRSYLDLHAIALAGAGRETEALQLLEKAFDDHPAEHEVLLAATVAMSAGDQARAKALIDKHEQKLDAGALRALVGLQAKGQESHAAKIIRAAEKGPADAWDEVNKFGEEPLDALGEQLLVLLAAEFHRVGDEAHAQKLYAQVRQQQLLEKAIYAYVERGEESADLAATEARIRAPLYLARALAVEASGGDGTRLRERAAKADVPHGFVAWAASHWSKGVRPPPPSDEDAPLTFVRVAAHQ